MAIKLIIFDWDDVFTLGSKEGYIKCLHDTITDLGAHLDPAEEHRRILETWSQPHQAELAGLLREHPELLDQAVKLYEDKFFGGTFVQALSYLDGANAMLERLHSRYKLGVATGAHPQVLKDQVMPKFHVPDVFDQIISGYDIDNPDKQKPHPHMLQTIMATQHATPAETIFVGDAASDVKMARAAQVEPVVVLTGHLDREQAEALGVKYIVPDVTHLESMLTKLNSRSLT